MGTIIETDADVADTGEIITPAVQALAWYDLGESAALSLRNLADPANAPALVNAFAGADGYMTLGGNSGNARINTRIQPPDGFTAFLVVRRSEGSPSTDVRFFSNYSSVAGVNSGATIRFPAAGGIAYSHGAGGTALVGSVPATDPPMDPYEWRLLVINVDAGATMGVRDLTDGVGNLSGLGITTGLPPVAPIWLGSNPVPVTGGLVDIAIAAIYPGDLSAAQIDEVASFIRSEIEIKMPGVAV